MAFPDSSKKARIGQSTYWTWFGANMLVVPALLIGGLYMLGTGSYGTGILMILGILPLGIWFRVVMMRRCRDIGWPAFSPWLFMGGSFLIGLLSPMRMAAGDVPGAGMLLLPALLGLGDFVFSIAIGCIGSKADVDYGDVFGPEGQGSERYGAPAYAMARPQHDAAPPPRQGPSRSDEAPDMARYDDAIARALEAHKQRERLASAGAAPGMDGAARMAGRGAATFGRKGA